MHKNTASCRDFFCSSKSSSSLRAACLFFSSRAALCALEVSDRFAEDPDLTLAASLFGAMDVYDECA
eukprot:CAMPEP_0202906544 /NCGR_PEP_ID=MMETSP1392-20130828/39358_1 /ASSEMBLY_ACC=CAM_ASM_000868 /TAXON_ID=225041 /ORGANISM="Chlamydomonas chlamydogama, Strain SAG 11-48b" /LENGTH=66 /DNA_ID=CAMNT_0049595109 /DNA_START=27 /DNA_END=227 /DNA_ORIENTATION=+